MKNYMVIIDGKKIGVKAPHARAALGTALYEIDVADLENRLESPPTGKSKRVTISIVGLA
jgi:hypothetical protein